MSSDLSASVSGKIFGLLILISGLFFSHGLFSAYWLWTLPASMIVVLFSPPLLKRSTTTLIYYYLPPLFFLIAALFITRGFGQLGNLQNSEPDREWLVYSMRGLYSAAAVSAFYCLRFRSSKLFSLTVLLVSLGLIALLFSSPRPWIDVWSVQEAATSALLHGKNPYSIEYLNFYPSSLQPTLNPYGNPFVYLPGVLYLLAPAKWLGLDVRVALVLAFAASAYLIASLRTFEGKQNYFTSLLFLSIPFVPYLIDQAWNDVFTVLFIALCAYSLQNKSRSIFILSLVGMTLIKQHVFLVLPILIFYGSRELSISPVKTAGAWLFFFAIGCLPFAIWDWTSFVGSLWGFHALTHSTGTAFPDRQDGFSLLNWLTQNTGYRPSNFFIAVAFIAVIPIFSVKNRLRTTSNVFTACALVLLAVFAVAPLAFLNYYWVCIGFLICAISLDTSEKSIVRFWPSDLIFFGTTRCLLLFSTLFFQSQTTFYNFFAAEGFRSLVPFQSFGYRLMPLSQIPMAMAGWLAGFLSAPPLLSYRLCFIALSLIADTVFYLSIRRRCRRSNLIIYGIASSLLFEQFYDHVELWAGFAVAVACIEKDRKWVRYLTAIVAFGFQWTSGVAIALSELLIGRREMRFAGFAVLMIFIAAITVCSEIPLAQFFARTTSEPNLASIANFVDALKVYWASHSVAIAASATATVALILAIRKSVQPLPLILFTSLVFDPFAGTGALVLILPCLALATPVKGRYPSVGIFLIATCALRTLEFHHVLPSIGASQIALLMTYLAALATELKGTSFGTEM